MKNFEKYEKEIKKIGFNFGINSFNELKSCLDILNCNYCKFQGKASCNANDKLNWLYEEYKEPLLTDEEREYLKVVIKPFKNISYIVKSTVYLSVCMPGNSHNGNVLIGLEDGYKFKGLEREKHYTLEELGL